MWEIEWRGVDSVAHEELEEAILTTEADWRPWIDRRPFDEGTLEQDVERIRRFYRRKGFYQATVESQVEERSDDSVVVTLHVVEGPTVVLETFRLTLREAPAGEPASDRPPLDATALIRELALKQGEPFSVERYGRAKEALLGRLADRGYPAARIAGGAEVRPETHAATVEWKLDPGPYVRLGEARVVGLDRVARDLVLGEVSWRIGDPHDRSRLRETQRAVFDLGLFRSVAVRAVEPDGEGRESSETWPVEIEVHERDPRALRASVGFGSDDLLRGRLEWKHRNFMGGLRTLRIGAKYSFLERGVDVVFEQPRFLDRETTLTLDTVVSQETQPAFDSQGLEVGWRIERPVLGNWKARLGQRFELREVTNIEADPGFVALEEDEVFRLVFFEMGLRRSTLDSQLDPHSGTWLDLSFEPALRGLGSDVGYLKGIADARVFFPLPLRFVLGSRVKLGTLEPIGKSGPFDVPVFKRFFSGGTNSVRGFDLDHLGPLDESGDPVGGFTLAEASIELRRPLWRELGGVIFVDAGEVALDSFELRGDDVFYSAGAGLRYQTPIGPLRLDFARILNPPSEVGSFGVHFSVGHTF